MQYYGRKGNVCYFSPPLILGLYPLPPTEPAQTYVDAATGRGQPQTLLRDAKAAVQASPSSKRTADIGKETQALSLPPPPPPQTYIEAAVQASVPLPPRQPAYTEVAVYASPPPLAMPSALPL